MNRYIRSRGLVMGTALAALSYLAVGTPIVALAQTASSVYEDMDRGRFAITATLAIKAEHVSEFLDMAKARIQESRKAPGVVDFRILATQDPSRFVSFESFSNKEAFESFHATPASATFLEKVKPILVGALDVQILQALP